MMFLLTIYITDLGRELTDALIIHSGNNGVSEIFLITSFIELPEIEWYSIEEYTAVSMLQAHYFIILISILCIFSQKKYWFWNLHKPVYHMNYFLMSRRPILLVGFADMNCSRLSLFHFDIKSSNPKYW